VDNQWDPETKFGADRGQQHTRRNWRRLRWQIACFAGLSAGLALGAHTLIERGREAAARAH
jgi:hypothetical protein